MARYIIFYQILCNVVLQKSTREVVLLLNVPQFMINQYLYILHLSAVLLELSIII